MNIALGMGGQGEARDLQSGGVLNMSLYTSSQITYGTFDPLTIEFYNHG